MSNTVRQLGGKPSGGEYAPVIHGEAPLTLTPDFQTDEEWNAGGTFAFPPPPRNLGQMVAFWRMVEVPDAILDQIETAYERDWNDWSAEQCSQWDSAHPEPKLMPGRKATHAEERKTFIAHLPNYRPISIPRSVNRQLARLTRLTWQVGELTPSEIERFNNTQVQIATISGLPGNIIGQYQFERIEDAFYDDPERVRSQEIIGRLDGVETAVDDLRVSRQARDFLEEGEGAERARYLAEQNRGNRHSR